MRIKSLKIRNFRGFENETFCFDPSLTVVVGNNTTGKTTLLKSVLVSLGAYLKSLKGLPSGKPYSMNFSQSDVFRRFDEDKKDFFNNPESTRIDVAGEFFITKRDDAGDYISEPVSVQWYREFKGGTTTHSQKCAGELIRLASDMESARSSKDSDENAIYPLVLSFGVKRIDNDYRSANKRKARESRIEKAYKSALLETVDFKSTFDWLYRYDSNLSKEREFAGTREAFMQALADAIPAMSNIEVDSKNNEFIALIGVRDEPAQYQTFENMSDGFYR